MLTTNTTQPKSANRPMRGPTLTSNMAKAKWRYDGLDPKREEPTPNRRVNGAILTQANRQDLLDNRPEVKAARIAALVEAKAKKKARKAKKQG